MPPKVPLQTARLLFRCDRSFPAKKLLGLAAGPGTEAPPGRKGATVSPGRGWLLGGPGHPGQQRGGPVSFVPVLEELRVLALSLGGTGRKRLRIPGGFVPARTRRKRG